LNGDGLKALEIYNSILIPNEQTYSIILNACSHSLLVNQAQQIFNSISIQHRNVFIYATIVNHLVLLISKSLFYLLQIDALCRSLKINEAQILLAEYEKTNKKYPSMYITLLTAYSRLKNLNKVMEIYNLIKEYFPNDIGYISSATILLANTHAFLGNISEAIRLRTNSVINGIVKFPGISWTETNDGEIHEFIAHDIRHKQTKEIYEELKRISDEIKQDGYISDERWITSDRGFNEYMNPLHSHSERLALAYQLYLRRNQLNNNNEPIQITKNLRICGDCHEIFKRITRIHQGLIILARDRTRQHKFQQGKCSCNDYF
jgi:tetratricopeptide (TPR) repeat protein